MTDHVFTVEVDPYSCTQEAEYVPGIDLLDGLDPSGWEKYEDGDINTSDVDSVYIRDMTEREKLERIRKMTKQKGITKGEIVDE